MRPEAGGACAMSPTAWRIDANQRAKPQRQ
jgi:hypothetical protein